MISVGNFNRIRRFKRDEKKGTVRAKIAIVCPIMHRRRFKFDIDTITRINKSEKKALADLK